MARTTAAQREAARHAAKPLHFTPTGGGAPTVCGLTRAELPYHAARRIHPAFVTDEHLVDPNVCPACVVALPTADRSLPDLFA